MRTTWKARPTVYKGIAMRSRLEATFAAYLDDIWVVADEQWAYEPRAYAGSGGQYLPDFEILGALRPVFFEVKPTVDSVVDAGQRMRVIWESVPNALLMIAVADGSLWLVQSKDVIRMRVDIDGPVEWATWR